MATLKRYLGCILAMCLLSVAAAIPAHAEEFRWYASNGLNVSPARSNHQVGLDYMAGSYFVRAGVDLTIEYVNVPNDDDRYQWTTLSNGQRRCRDTESGQFAASARCEDQLDVNLYFGPLVSVGAVFDEMRWPLFATVGNRLMGNPTWHGEVGIIGPGWSPDMTGLVYSVEFGEETAMLKMTFLF